MEQRRDPHGVECRRGEFTMEPMRTSPVQPRQRQKSLSRPLDMADGPDQDPEANQGLGVNSFKTIGGKPSRHRSTGGEHHNSSSEMLSAPPDSQCKKAASTAVQHHHTSKRGQPEPRQLTPFKTSWEQLQNQLHFQDSLQ